MATEAHRLAANAAAWNRDLLLAKRCAAREPAAIRELTGACNQRLFRAAWGILKNRSDAEDAVQSAYLKAFVAMESYAGQSSLSTWLTRIVVNESLGRLRSAARRKARLDGNGVAVLDEYREKMMAGSAAARPDAAIASKQLRAMIEQAISGLPDAFRTVFILREIEGMSIEETADALGIAAATVKTRLLRARRRIQQSLEPDVRSALEGAFPFAGASCEAMTRNLMLALL